MDPKGKSKGGGQGQRKKAKEMTREMGKVRVSPIRANPLTRASPTGKGNSTDEGKSTGKGKSESRDEPHSREDKPSRSDPKGPNRVPESWKNKTYDEIPIVQSARPSDDCVAAYVQGAGDIPTFRVVWITSEGATKREVQVSPNKFKDNNHWSTPMEQPDFWSPLLRWPRLCHLDTK